MSEVPLYLLAQPEPPWRGYHRKWLALQTACMRFWSKSREKKLEDPEEGSQYATLSQERKDAIEMEEARGGLRTTFLGAAAFYRYLLRSPALFAIGFSLAGLEEEKLNKCWYVAVAAMLVLVTLPERILAGMYRLAAVVGACALAGYAHLSWGLVLETPRAKAIVAAFFFVTYLLTLVHAALPLIPFQSGWSGEGRFLWVAWHLSLFTLLNLGVLSEALGAACHAAQLECGEARETLALGGSFAVASLGLVSGTGAVSSLRVYAQLAWGIVSEWGQSLSDQGAVQVHPPLEIHAATPHTPHPTPPQSAPLVQSVVLWVQGNLAH